jgi:hypothetical protein
LFTSIVAINNTTTSIISHQVAAAAVSDLRTSGIAHRRNLAMCLP